MPCDDVIGRFGQLLDELIGPKHLPRVGHDRIGGSLSQIFQIMRRVRGQNDPPAFGMHANDLQTARVATDPVNRDPGAQFICSVMKRHTFVEIDITQIENIGRTRRRYTEPV